VLRSLAVS